MSHQPSSRRDAETVTTAALRLETPKPGDVHPGDRVEIRWTSEGAIAHEVEVSVDGGPFVAVCAPLPGIARMTIWAVPESILEGKVRGEVLIRVTARSDDAPTSVSSSKLPLVREKRPSVAPPPPMSAPTESRPAISLESIEPNNGPVTGGTTLTVYGRNFQPFTVARVGGRDAATKFESNSSLRVITPPGKGSVFADVLVMNPDTRVAALPNAFRYDAVPAPTVAAVTPKTGGVVGGTKVRITGANFTPRSIVTIGGTRPWTTTFVEPGMLEIVTPARNDSGLVDVVVTNCDGQTGVVKQVFRYDPVPAPIIESVVPKRGALKGGETLTILGKNFGPRTQVEVAGQLVRAVNFIDAQTIEVVTPKVEQAGLVDIRVRNPDGQIAGIPRIFQFE